MSFKEVKEYRKSGDLEKALELAIKDHDERPDDIWSKRALSWVYYDLLVQSMENTDLEAFYLQLDNIRALDLPESENMFYDSISWKIGKLIYNLGTDDASNLSILHKIFDKMVNLSFSKGTEAYSFLLKAFLTKGGNWTKLDELIEWWGLENFTPEDYNAQEYNGKAMMALAERAYIAYCKKLLEGKTKEDNFANIFAIPGGPVREIDKEKIKSFLPQLDELIEERPEYMYPGFYKAKLLLAIGDKENVLTSFLPFAKKKQRDFWVWDVLADVFSEDKEKYIACLCKALSCVATDDFLVKIRGKLFKVLIELKKFDEARFELDRIIAIKKEKGWKVSPVHSKYLDEAWYADAKELNSNADYYAMHLHLAEEILFSNLDEEIAVVEFVQQKRKIINFVMAGEQYGFCKYHGLNDVQIGDVLEVRFTEHTADGFYKVATMKKTDLDEVEGLLKKENGSLEIKEGSQFGFANNIFVSPPLIKHHSLSNGDDISGKAAYSYNKKNNSWGWKMISIDP